MATRVVFCAHDYPGYFAGGPNAWLQRLLPDLEAKGLEVTTLVIGVGDPAICPMVSELRSKGLQVRFLSSEGRHRFLQHRIRWIVDQINDLKPHVFVPNVVVAAYFAGKWLREAGIPSIGVIHSCDSFHRHLADTFVRGEQNCRVSAIAAVSSYIQNDIAQDMDPGVVLEKIPCGVPVPEKVHRIPSERLRVAYVGRFTQEQKRIHDVTVAFCLASRALPHAKFTLLGAGPELHAMQDIIATHGASSSVQIRDPLPASRVLEFMQSQDVFVLLSDYEGMPIALQEAMAVGTVPVCLREDSGISELIRHGQNGLIVADRNEDFVTALVRLDTDRILLAKLAAKARETIRQGYGSVDQHEKWKTLIGRVAGAGPKGKIRLPLRLNLPASHPSFRGEDLHAPSVLERSKIASMECLNALRQLIRPRSRLREVWKKLANRI